MKEKATAFAVGATGYPCIEILARGHTHWSMALLGGICVLALVWIARRYPGMNIAVQAALGTAFITAAELAVGLVVNRALGWQVWDYSREFGNVLGQICPLFSFYWFLLCLPIAADYAMEAFARLRGLPGRRVIAAGFLLCCFTSSTLTVARECVSDYQAYSAADIETAEFVRENTPEHSIFLTGNQHLNPVSSLAGRTILCSSDLYLYYHGFNTTQRQAEIAAFYANPAANLDLLRQYQVQYIYVSPYERANTQYAVNEAALEALFPVIYESAGGQNRIFEVPEEYRQ